MSALPNPLEDVDEAIGYALRETDGAPGYAARGPAIRVKLREAGWRIVPDIEARAYLVAGRLLGDDASVLDRVAINLTALSEAVGMSTGGLVFVTMKGQDAAATAAELRAVAARVERIARDGVTVDD